MLHYKDPGVAAKFSKYEFGLEKESLRVLGDGTFAHTPHPFPVDKYIVRDFCENQIEINTGVSSNEEDTINELESYERHVREVLRNLPEKEYVWHFSNPPSENQASEITEIIAYQKAKIDGTGKRYAERVLEDYGNDFLGNGLKTVTSNI